MKALKFVVPFVMAMLVSSVFAGDVAKEEKKGDGKDKLTGLLEKAPETAKDVTAVLKVKKDAGDESVNLVATGEAAEKLTKNIGKTVTVVGKKNDAGAFAVTTVQLEEKKEGKKEGEKKHDKKAGHEGH